MAPDRSCGCVHEDEQTAELAADENFDTDATQLGQQAKRGEELGFSGSL